MVFVPDLNAYFNFGDREPVREQQVVDRAAGQIDHRAFAELPQFVRKGDLFVLNDTRVLAARLLMLALS